jgi:hypothetical protein
MPINRHSAGLAALNSDGSFACATSDSLVRRANINIKLKQTAKLPIFSDD